MSWKAEIEKLLRDQMRYAFVLPSGRYADAHPVQFDEALGYVLEHIENLIEKKAFFDGYACGGAETVDDCNGLFTKLKDELMAMANPFKFNKDLSRVGAERAWLKRGDANT